MYLLALICKIFHSQAPSSESESESHTVVSNFLRPYGLYLLWIFHYSQYLLEPSLPGTSRRSRTSEGAVLTEDAAVDNRIQR